MKEPISVSILSGSMFHRIDEQHRAHLALDTDAYALADAAAMMILDDNGEAPAGQIPRYERVVDMARAWAITRGWREPSPDDMRREEEQ